MGAFGATMAAGRQASVATPAAAAASAKPYCALFTKVRERLSVSFGSKVDPLTRFSGVDVRCDQKAIVFLQEVSLESRYLPDEWIARRQKHWSKTYCQPNAAFAQAISAGWKISTVLTLADGNVLRFDAACHDADA